MKLSSLFLLAVAWCMGAATARAQVARFRTLHAFSATDSNGANTEGAQPHAGLLLGLDGNFYGTANAGGANANGTVFRCTPGGTVSALYTFSAYPSSRDFSNADGAAPQAGLIQDGAGNLYGTAEFGGANAEGTAFEVTLAGGFTDLHDFGSEDGRADGTGPTGPLLLTPDGLMAGTATGGGDSNADGTFFFLEGTSFGPALDFGGSLGIDPSGPLAFANPPGAQFPTIYGACEVGGNTGDPEGIGSGIIFGLPGAAPGGTLQAVYTFSAVGADFDNSDGAEPLGGVILGRDNNLYGTASEGGPNGLGTVWQIVVDPDSGAGSLTVLHAFDGGDGGVSRAPLVEGSDGSFYGTTADGGPAGHGVVFRVTTGKGFTVLHSFSAEDNNNANGDGAHPFGGLVEVRPGSFVGTGSDGGANENGTIFEVDVAPVITSAATATGNKGSAFSYQITAADGPGSYSVDGLGDGLSVNAATGLISGTPTVAGTLHLNVHASNDAGTGSKALAVTVKGPLPVITSAGSATAVVGKAFSYTITAQGATNFAVANLQPGLALNHTSGVISGTPKGPPGVYTLTLKAANANGTATAPLTLTVGAVPAITSAAAATAFTGQPFSYQITATNSPTTYTVGGLSDGLSLNKPDGLIFGTPTTPGTLTLTVDAFNAYGHSSKALTVTVKQSAPVITSAGGKLTTPVGQPFSYQITATNAPTSFAVGGLTDGLTLNKTTGVISGTPGTEETLNLVLHAYNGGGQGSKTVQIVVFEQ